MTLPSKHLQSLSTCHHAHAGTQATTFVLQIIVGWLDIAEAPKWSPCFCLGPVCRHCPSCRLLTTRRTFPHLPSACSAFPWPLSEAAASGSPPRPRHPALPGSAALAFPDPRRILCIVCFPADADLREGGALCRLVWGLLLKCRAGPARGHCSPHAQHPPRSRCFVEGQGCHSLT